MPIRARSKKQELRSKVLDAGLRRYSNPAIKKMEIGCRKSTINCPSFSRLKPCQKSEIIPAKKNIEVKLKIRRSRRKLWPKNIPHCFCRVKYTAKIIQTKTTQSIKRLVGKPKKLNLTA